MCTESRPVLQGARLSSYELKVDGFPVTLISDTMVGYVMGKGMIDKVLVGADRVVKSGHVFNKIGTYQVAVLAQRHGIPFYPCVPSPSFDLKSRWEDIVIEERDPREVFSVRGRRIAPRGVRIFNPAFDVTPPELVSAIISDRGILERPFDKSIAEAFDTQK